MLNLLCSFAGWNGSRTRHQKRCWRCRSGFSKQWCRGCICKYNFFYKKFLFLYMIEFNILKLCKTVVCENYSAELSFKVIVAMHGQIFFLIIWHTRNYFSTSLQHTNGTPESYLDIFGHKSNFHSVKNTYIFKYAWVINMHFIYYILICENQ